MKALEKVSIDIGCGHAKREGTLGIDILDIPEVDYVVDLTKESLPFEDNSVDYVHSAHFLEHIPAPDAIFKEISRVCKPGARIELWTPYVWSNDGFVVGHQTFYSEEIYLHMCVKHAEIWAEALGKRWLLHEIQYVVGLKTLQNLKRFGIDLSFAIRHYQNVVTEFGVYISLVEDLTAPSVPLLRTFSTLRHGERYALKNTQVFDDLGGGRPGRDILRTFARGKALPPRQEWS